MRRWIMSGAGILIVAIIIIGNLNWNEKVNETVKEAEVTMEKREQGIDKDESTKEDRSENEFTNNASEKNNETIKKDEKTKSELDSSNDSSSEKAQKTETKSEQVGTSNSDTKEKPSETKSSGSTSPEQDNKTNEEAFEPLTLGQIKDKYFLQFRDQERIENRKLEDLYLEAYDEHQFYTNNDISFSRDEFVRKYQTKAEQLEVEADAVVYTIYENMQEELRRNGFSVEEADPYIEAYETAKERRRNSLFSLIN